MGKKSVRSVVMALVVVSICLAIPASAYAYATSGKHKLKYGVGDSGKSDQHYFVDSAASKYNSSIDGAVHDWVFTTSRLHITTPISYTRTSTQSSSRMDFHYGTYHAASAGLTADTTLYVDDTPVGGYLAGDKQPTVNWVWAKVRLNNPNFSNLGTFDKRGCAAHEMGHGMGLLHATNTGAIMCRLGDGRTVNSAQKDDLAGINYLY